MSMQGMSAVPPGATMASAWAFIETEMRRAVAVRRELDRRQLTDRSKGAGQQQQQQQEAGSSAVQTSLVGNSAACEATLLPSVEGHFCCGVQCKASVAAVQTTRAAATWLQFSQNVLNAGSHGTYDLHALV